MPKLKNLTGNKIGKLTVISRAPSKYGKTMWNCICECGNTCIVYRGNLIGEKRQNGSCGCSRKRTAKLSPSWKGFERLSGTHFGHIRARAFKYKIPFSVDTKYLWKLFISQNECCAISGLSISFSSTRKAVGTTASLDRIDSDKGYVKGNVQWVHKDVNIMKYSFKQNYFIKLCKIISKNYEGN